MNYFLAAQTEVGLKKSCNQDSVILKRAKFKGEEVCIGIICDGMGGLSCGELASKSIAEAFSEWFLYSYSKYESIWDDWDWGKGYLKLPYEEIKVPVKLDKISEQTEFYKVMRYSRIPFGHINQEEFMDILQEWNEAGYHLSRGTVDQIRKRRGEDAI